jgi:hypothetical protein
MKIESNSKDVSSLSSLINEIRSARDSGIKYFSKPHDFPFGVHKLDLNSRRESEVRQFKHLHQNSFILAGDLLTACQLRLVLLLDGYLSLVDSKNGLPMFGVTRSIMEMNGLLLLLKKRLSKFRNGDTADWRSRGEGFFSYLVRARYGTRDSDLVKQLLSNGFSKSSLEPIHSKDCEDALFSDPEFSIDKPIFGILNDLVHTNVQGYNFGIPSWHESNSVWFGNSVIMLPEPVPVIRYQYPAPEKQDAALKLTADPTCRHVNSILELIKNFPMSPFSETEVIEKTGSKHLGRIIESKVIPRTKTKAILNGVGRNNRCPCGSGRKFKHCCLN